MQRTTFSVAAKGDSPGPAAEVASMIYKDGTLQRSSVALAVPGKEYSVSNAENCTGVFQIFNLGEHQSATGFIVAKFPARDICNANGVIVHNVLAVGLIAAHCIRENNTEIFCHFNDRDLKESKDLFSEREFLEYVSAKSMFKVKLLADSGFVRDKKSPTYSFDEKACATRCPIWRGHQVLTYESDLAAIAIVDETIQGLTGTLEAVLDGRAVYSPAMLPQTQGLHVVGYPFAVTIGGAPLSEDDIRTMFYNLAYKTASPVTVVGESNNYLFICAATQKGHSGSPILDLATKQAFAVLLGGVRWAAIHEDVADEYRDLQKQLVAVARRAKEGWEHEWAIIEERLRQCAVAVEAQTVNHAMTFDHPAATALLAWLATRKIL